jgi:HK97 family phage portal protein
VLPELTQVLSKALRGAKNAFKDSGPTELGLSGPSEGKDVAFDMVNVGWYARNGYSRLYSLLTGGQPAWSGEVVSLATAFNHSVVWACNRLISETQGATPLNMLQQKKNAKQLAEDKPLYQALRNAPNDEQSAMTFQETRTSHCAMEGNGFAQIIRRSGTGEAIQLLPLDPSQVRIDRDKQKQLVYLVKTSVDGVAGNNETSYTVQAGKPQDILHIRGLSWDGMRGYSVVSMARQSIGTSLSVERNVGRFYAAGGRVPYHLEMAKKFKSDEDFAQFRQDWEKTYSSPHKVPVLENDMKLVQDGLSAVDSQMLETRLFDIHEICRWFLVSPHLVGDLSRATFSNIEQLALEFVKVTMQPWFTRWEQDLWRCVLTPEEKTQGYYFKHNANELLRGDFLTRMQGYSIMLQNGVASQNEIRDLEDWNPFKGGDGHNIQLNMQPIPIGGLQAAPPAGSQAPSLVRIDE